MTVTPSLTFCFCPSCPPELNPNFVAEVAAKIPKNKEVGAVGSAAGGAGKGGSL